MSWFLVILFLSLTCGNLEASSHYNKNKLPSAVVVGSVFCDSCSQHDFSMGSHFISGASVAVECKDGNSKPRFKTEVKTDEHGEFKVNLPFNVRKHVKKIKGCTFKLVSSSEPYCSVASYSTSSSVSLKTRKDGEHTFSAGVFSFKPTKKPSFCNKKQRIPNKYSSFHKGSKSNPSERSERSHFSNDPEDFFFPPPIIPNPFQPPPLIPNPLQPPPLIPIPFPTPSPSPLIPNPFQPPSPPPFIPNPFQPPSPPPLFPNPFQPPSPPPLIPNPFQPPPSKPPPIFPFPPTVIPGLTPSPPPPPPSPTFPFPFPPLFPPPRSPGSPPSSSKNTLP